MQRIDTLEAAPVPGRRYLVPCVHGPWGWTSGRPNVRWWPVLLPEHSDREFFRFVLRHYHVDVRFVGARYRMKRDERAAPGVDASAFCAFAIPLITEPGPKSQVQWRARTCLEVPGLDAHDAALARYVGELREHYAGHVCPEAAGRRRCPHRMADLQSVTVGPDGTVTCPVHGLKINPKTWTVVPAEPRRKVTVEVDLEGPHTGALRHEEARRSRVTADENTQRAAEER